MTGLLVLWALGLAVLDLPVHLVHHLDEVNPDCQLLGLSGSLSSSSLDGSWLRTADRTWDEMIVPILSPEMALLWESVWARAPPHAIAS